MKLEKRKLNFKQAEESNKNQRSKKMKIGK